MVEQVVLLDKKLNIQQGGLLSDHFYFCNGQY